MHRAAPGAFTPERTAPACPRAGAVFSWPLFSEPLREPHKRPRRGDRTGAANPAGGFLPAGPWGHLARSGIRRLLKRRVPIFDGTRAEKLGAGDGTKNNVHFVTERGNDSPASRIFVRAGNQPGISSGRQAVCKTSGNLPSQIRPDNIGSASCGGANRKGCRSQGTIGSIQCSRPEPSRARRRTNALGVSGQNQYPMKSARRLISKV